MNLTMKLFFD